MLDQARDIAHSKPLAEALSFAFKAGYHDEEEIWLRGEDESLVRISTWDTDPPYTDTCGISWSTGGYTGGRFGRIHFAPGGDYLLFSENLACNPTAHPSRVLAHELASGVTRVLAETTEQPSIIVSEDVAIVVVRIRTRCFRNSR